ncbi:hypothetical protein [Streptomyces violascens]|uniref:hypothetical protein n=1 Tax=Streptomyces violascens TaxID=67381 RepID=UPI001676857E|nr:hypothetical protein [Streptomyces violascens]GGU29955.1 hypothetical protein GCM10010289_59220 [Streptomyces violascens]
MTKHRALGTGPRPATPPAQPTATHRARLAAEPAETPHTAAEGPALAPRSPSRRQLGTGPEAGAR